MNQTTSQEVNVTLVIDQHARFFMSRGEDRAERAREFAGYRAGRSLMPRVGNEAISLSSNDERPGRPFREQRFRAGSQ